MFVRRLIVFVAMLLPTSVPALDFKVEGFSIRDLPEVEIRVWDNAKDGCWTSIRSSKANLGDKLDLAGVEVVEQSTYRALIEVNASRLQPIFNPYRGWSEGRCFGSARITVYAKEPPLDANNPMNVYQISDQIFTGYGDANELVFQMIDEITRPLE